MTSHNILIESVSVKLQTLAKLSFSKIRTAKNYTVYYIYRTVSYQKKFRSKYTVHGALVYTYWNKLIVLG